MHDKKMLVAQDSEATFRLLQIRADQVNFPFAIDWVENGQLAVDKIKENPTYDVILMNIKMPVMDGLEATREIRKLGYTKPIIAWSAYSRAWMWEACQKAGMDEYVHTKIGMSTVIEDVALGLYLCKVIGHDEDE